MSILQNAIDSIELGVEDYKTNQPKRLLSAVRNFYAGILLLFKHKLALLSQHNDEALLKQKVLPVEENGKIVWKGKGKITVDFKQILERFDSLGIKIDWERLKKAQDYRNNIEHYYDKNQTKPGVVQQYISDCFIIICEFIRSQLSEDPKELFDPVIWDTLIQENEVYLADKKICSDAMDKLEWISDFNQHLFEEFVCPVCGSDLIEPIDISSEKDAEEVSFRCRVCDEEWYYDNLLDLVCEKISERDHIHIRDGGEPTFGYCPECSEEYYHSGEEVCLKCGITGPFRCQLCDCDVPVCELPLYGLAGVCSWCNQVRMKDD